MKQFRLQIPISAKSEQAADEALKKAVDALSGIPGVDSVTPEACSIESTWRTTDLGEALVGMTNKQLVTTDLGW